MTWYVFTESTASPRYLADPYDEWVKKTVGYFFVEPDEYQRYKRRKSSLNNLKGARYTFEKKILERKTTLSSLSVAKAHMHVEDLPPANIGDIQKWLDEHSTEIERERFSHIYENSVVSDGAIEFFEEHLYDHALTVRMVDAIETAQYDMNAHQLTFLMLGAMFHHAVNICDVDSTQDLPFELDDEACRIIDGSKSKKAMEEHCNGMENREGAAALNQLLRYCKHKEPYKWTDDIICNGMICDDYRTLMSFM